MTWKQLPKGAGRYGIGLLIAYLLWSFIEPKANQLWQINIGMLQEQREKINELEARLDSMSATQGQIKENIDVDYETNKYIQDELNTVRSEKHIDACRLGLYWLHNGKSSVGGVEFFFYSMRHESDRRGTSPALNASQGISTATITEFQKYFQNGWVVSKLVSEINDNTLREMFELRGTIFVIAAPVRSQEQTLIGCVIAEYTNRTITATARIGPGLIRLGDNVRATMLK